VKEKTIVISIEGKEALVRTIPDEKCSKCCSCSASRTKTFKINIEEAGGVSPGDLLDIEVSNSSMMRIYFLIYAAPLAVFLLFLSIFYKVWASPVLSFFGAVSAMAAAYAAVAFYFKKRPRVLPTVTVRKIAE